MRVLKSRVSTFALIGLVTVSVAVVFVTGPSLSVQADGPSGRTYIVVYSSPTQASPNTITAKGHKVVADLSKAGVLIVRSNNPQELAALPGVTGVSEDRIRIRVPKEEGTQAVDPSKKVKGCASTQASCPLQWDLDRIHLPAAWKMTHGSAHVKVAVLDTGLRSTHEEVGKNYDITDSRSFVQPTPDCPADANTFQSIEDFQGHGTWTNTHVAGVNGAVMTGIAPRTSLLNVRVLGACGFGLDSWILAGMIYANTAGAQIESMSLGGYVCADGVVPGSFYCATPDKVANGPAIWQAYKQVVDFLRSAGTIVVAAAGNEHVRLDNNGRVTSVGSLAFSVPANDPSNDLRGTAEIPGGVPGVIAVGAVNRMTAEGGAKETKFGQFGVGRRDQLAYYSNYGPRIDVSAPGGARNFNVPNFDCLSDNCLRLDPSTSGATDNPGDFGAWAFDPAGKPCDTCYVNIQGTSMATPQVAGVAALALASHPNMTTDQLVALLCSSVTSFLNKNETPRVTSDPNKPTYNFDLDYGTPGIPNDQMGTGVIDAALAVNA